MNLKRTKISGAYLLVIGLIQIIIYIAMSASPADYDWLFYFDPRIGIFYFEIVIRGTERITPEIFRWLSGALISIIGLILVLRSSHRENLYCV